MRQSQYLNGYLRDTANGRRVTPRTYVNSALSGRAKNYAATYVRALINSLETLVSRGEVLECLNERGATYYERVQK